jgi:hypothetical protein
MSVTELVSHEERSPLNALAAQNIEEKSRTFPTFHRERSLLKRGVCANILLMFVTAEVSKAERSPLTSGEERERRNK